MQKITQKKESHNVHSSKADCGHAGIQKSKSF